MEEACLRLRAKASVSRAEWARCGSRSGRGPDQALGGPEISSKVERKPPEGLETGKQEDNDLFQRNF